MNTLKNSAIVESCGCECNPSLTERLRTRKIHLEQELSQITDALEAMERHPEISDMLDRIAKLGVRY